MRGDAGADSVQGMNDNPIRLLIHGASGRMGQALVRLAGADPRLSVVAAASRRGVPAPGQQVPCCASAVLGDCTEFDVAIDFSLPEGFEQILSECRVRGAALVSGTTGLDDSQRAMLARASQDIPVVWASNFSLGVVLLEDLVRRAAAALPAWAIHVSDVHHVHKKDAPSGTALTLAAAAQAGGGVEPAISSLRQGEVVGEHVVSFSGPGETIELAHRAADRDIFARGALEAALLLARRGPGRYPLAELLLGQD